MATIALYKSKVNGVGGLLDNMIKSTNNLNMQIGTLKSTLQGVDSSTCDLQDTVDSIRSSSKSEEEKVGDLKKLNSKLNEFITMTVKRDNAAKDLINAKKRDFYASYAYLKPECEKSNLKKIADKVKTAAVWCKDHWKQIAVVLEAAVGVVCLFIPGLQAIGIKILAGIVIGALAGAIVGGAFGAASGYAQFGSDGVLQGMVDGGKEGLLFGAMLGGLGGVGMAAGEMIGCKTGMLAVHEVSSKLAIGMIAFDITSLGYNCQEQFIKDEKIDKRLIPSFIGTPISNANEKAHNNPFYNALQEVTFATAAFSAGYVSTAACFVAGTLVATACGLCAIETIRPGDMVLSANTETMETGYKPVVETYVRKVDKLVHLTVNGEEIITTVDHPFYVNGQEFVNAADLCIGSELLNSSGEIVKIESIFRESLKDDVETVYNFKVDEWHTYFVGNNCILVHNAEYKVNSRISERSDLIKEADVAGKNQRIQTEINSLVNEFSNGNNNPGIGSKNLFKDICYLRGRNGARVFYRITNGTMEILAKANKNNEQKVINILTRMYGG